MIAAEGYEELTATCRALLGSLQLLESLRRDYSHMEARTHGLDTQVTLVNCLGIGTDFGCRIVSLLWIRILKATRSGFK